MPELPEIYCRAKEMNQSLPGKQILSIEIIQPKCLNLKLDEFSSVLSNAVIEEVPYHGKWIKTKTTAGWLLINLGMGGEFLLTLRENIPDNYRLVIAFTDKTCLGDPLLVIRVRLLRPFEQTGFHTDDRQGWT